MHSALDFLRGIGSILLRRSVVLLIGGTIGYAVEALRQARMGSIEAQLPH